MPTVLPNTLMTLPVRGAPGSGTWGDTLDANLAILDVMDHTPGHGPLVPVAGLNINADLPFSALWAPTQLHRVQFSAIASAGLTAGQRTSLFVSDGTSGLVANELYWHNSAGNKVQMTAGNTLNFAAFVGGIGGDYTSVSATLNYIDGQKGYEFKEGTVDAHGWARLRSADLRLFPFNTTGAIFVGLAAPAGIAGQYTVTWPLALPGSTVLQQIDNTGQAIFSNTVPTLVTFSAGATAAVDQHITVSGTGLYKHGTRTISIAINAPRTGASPGFTGDSFTLTGASPQSALFQIQGVPVGARITAVRVRVKDSATGPTKMNVQLFPSTDGVAGASIATSITSAGTGAAQTLPLTGLTTTVVALTTYSIYVNTTTGAANTTVVGIDVDYDQ